MLSHLVKSVLVHGLKCELHLFITEPCVVRLGLAEATEFRGFQSRTLTLTFNLDLDIDLNLTLTLTLTLILTLTLTLTQPDGTS